MHRFFTQEKGNIMKKLLTLTLSATLGMAQTTHSETHTMNENDTLSPRRQSIARIAACTARGDIDALTPALAQGLDNGLSVNEINEVLIQMYAYAGFPRALNGISAFISVVEKREADGIRDEVGTAPETLPRDANKSELGERTRTQLVGRPTQAAWQGFAPGIDTFLKEHLFADIFARGVLSHQDRELATVAALSALDGTESQLQSHIAIAKRIGFTDAQIREVRALVTDSATHIDTVFARGEPNPYGKFFTGNTYLNMLSTYDTTWKAGIGNVTFEPGARTHWHSHSGGQILLVTAGNGFYQAKDAPAQPLKKGDVVRIPPNVVHWHGAAPERWFAHIALETNGADNRVTWLDPVTDDRYNSATEEQK